MCYGRGGTRADRDRRTLVLGRIPPHLLGGEIPLDAERGRARAVERWPAGSGSAWSARAAGHPRDRRLEPGQRRAPGDRQARAGRARLHAGRVRRLRAAAGRQAGRHPRPARPRWCRPIRATFGVRSADRRRQERLRAHRRRSATMCSTSSASTPATRARGAGRAQALAAEGFAADEMRLVRSRRTCATSARPGRCASRYPTGRIDRDRRRRGRRPLPRARTSRRTATRTATSPDQRIEWVNLRVMGIGPIRRPAIQPRPPTAGRHRARPHRAPPGVFRQLGSSTRRSTRAPTRSRATARRAGHRRGVRLHASFSRASRRRRRRLRQPAA